MNWLQERAGRRHFSDVTWNCAQQNLGAAAFTKSLSYRAGHLMRGYYQASKMPWRMTRDLRVNRALTA